MIVKVRQKEIIKSVRGLKRYLRRHPVHSGNVEYDAHREDIKVLLKEWDRLDIAVSVAEYDLSELSAEHTLCARSDEVA